MSSDKSLERIERSLKKVLQQQDAICAEVTALRERVDGLGGSATGVPRDELIGFLDQFRAGEALGEASTAAWVQVSDTECLKGGLRVVQQREGFHARLLEERIKELGGTPTFQLPDALVDGAMATVGGTKQSDAEKVKGFVDQFGDADKALAPLHAMADRLDDDPETQSLLRTICQDERSTIEFFVDACQLLNG